jgi:hypothetical protein
MRGVFSRTRRVAAVCLVITVLLAPSALASAATSDVSLWSWLVSWLASRLDVPGGVTAPPTEDEGRIDIPNGVAVEVDEGRIGIPGG